MAPLLMAALAGAAGLVGYKVLTKPRFVGDLAKAGPLASADQVEVPVSKLLASNSSIPPTSIPPGTTTVLVAVLGANKDTIQGPIIAFGTVPLPAPLGSVVVNRIDVTAVVRNGKVARGAKTSFSGESSRRFVG